MTEPTPQERIAMLVGTLRRQTRSPKKNFCSCRGRLCCQALSRGKPTQALGYAREAASADPSWKPLVDALESLASS